MLICPDCNREVPNAKFCKNCGCYLSEVEIKTNAVKDESYKRYNYCQNCGYELKGEFKFCPECGFDLVNLKNIGKHSSDAFEEKSMILAVILSVFLPGLGQFYIGLNHKGVIFLISYIVSAVLILVLIGFILCPIIWFWAFVDTIQSTNAINNGEYVEDKLLNR